MPEKHASKTQRPKIIVPIRIHGNRAHEFNAAIRSVGRHAEQFGHDVEVVVFDGSHKAESRTANHAAINHLKREFQGMPIHYYTPSSMVFVNTALNRMTNGDQSEAVRAFKGLVLEHGHRGSERNALALCAVRHGGKSAVYLHLEDHARLPTTERDELGLFIRQLPESGKDGYQSRVIRPSDAHQHNFTEVLATGSQAEPAGMSGRLLNFRGMTAAFPPLGRDTSEVHKGKTQIMQGMPRNTTDWAEHPLVLSSGQQDKEHIEKGELYPLIHARRLKPTDTHPDIEHAQGWRNLVTEIATLDAG